MQPNTVRRAAIFGAILVVALALGGAAWWYSHQGQEIVYAIPPGTSVRLAAGEAVEVLPLTIALKQNDTLIIRNDDTAAVQIGPFPIAPGQRFIQRYTSTGTYDLVCSLHEGQRLQVVVK